jgi:zinc transporter
MDGLEKTFALLLDGRGGARSLTLAQVRDWRPSDGLLWIHVPPDLPDLSRTLEAVFHVPSQVCEPLLAEVGRVRIDVLDDNQLVMLILDPAAIRGEPELKGLRAWMTDDRCVTVAETDRPAVVSIREQLAHGRGPRGPDLFRAFAATALSSASLRLTELDDVLAELEGRFEERRDAESVPEELRRLRRSLVDERRFVSLIRDALLRIGLLSVEWVRAQELELQQAAERANSVLKEVDALTERARILHDDEKSRQDDKSQRILYLLTIISGVFLPLSFITGLLGVNLGGIPGTQWNGAFLLLVLVLIVIAVAEWRALRRRELV